MAAQEDIYAKYLRMNREWSKDSDANSQRDQLATLVAAEAICNMLANVISEMKQQAVNKH